MKLLGDFGDFNVEGIGLVRIFEFKSHLSRLNVHYVKILIIKIITKNDAIFDV